eukprot:scaffold161148_cov19-Tisochrysis_lutea.AAC.2
MHARTRTPAFAHEQPTQLTHCHNLPFPPSTLAPQLVDVVVNNYSSVFPELRAARNVIHACIAEEETSFSRTLLKGIDRFKKQAEALKKEGKTQVGQGCVCHTLLVEHTPFSFWGWRRCWTKCQEQGEWWML